MTLSRKPCKLYPLTQQTTEGNYMEITTAPAENTIDGLSYQFSRRKIDYTVFLQPGCVTVWKTNQMRGSTSCDCYHNGRNHEGRPMAAFLKQALSLIASPGLAQ